MTVDPLMTVFPHSLVLNEKCAFILKLGGIKTKV